MNRFLFNFANPSFLFFLFFLNLFSILPAFAQESLSGFSSLKKSGRSLIFSTETGQKLRITPYGDFIVRVQAIRKDEDFFPDDYTEMVESHNWPGQISADEKSDRFILKTNPEDGLSLQVTKNLLRLSFFQNNLSVPFLQDKNGIQWQQDTLSVSFQPDSSEHFAGLGHTYFARTEKLDLKGEKTSRNYGTEHHQQAPLIVPFFLSGKGYGIFLNSTFPNSFSFGKEGKYEISVSGGRMDYFVIAGPDLTDVLDRYTQLTGRPRFPPKAAFGLSLSDKGNDHTSMDPSDENWWKRKINEHRAAGFPIDHIVNDNRWRAGGGQRCLSRFDWELTRYPDPTEYQSWVQKNHLFVTLDFNRCIASHSEGWKPDNLIPASGKIDFSDSAPDFTKKEVRDWFWNLFWTKSLNPDLNYPGDALWIDEFDEMGAAPDSMILGNGKTWKEMKNYWFFLIAKSLVADGWDKSFKETKRPFVWVRGMTAGAQRYATLWSGDIKPTTDDMKTQVRSMQSAGLSGFPFWGHDAGGFYNWETKNGPDDNLYRNWSMAFGSFSPTWKPHGVGESRWPLDRSTEVQKDAKTYSRLRYELMPYFYTYAHQAFETGIPIARAMILEFSQESEAWKRDLQYMWGNELLVAPNCSDSDRVSVWLPGGSWFDFWSDSLFSGNQVLSYPSPTGKLPLFVKDGAIIPMTNFALSTGALPADSLTIHIYTGRNGLFTLYEDDGLSEGYRHKEKRTTEITFNQDHMSVTVSPANGTYKNAPAQKAWTFVFHGFKKPVSFSVNGKKVKTNWDPVKKTLSLSAGSFSVLESIEVVMDQE
ncbi:MAG: glycoside hydrolase family 31 protein [Bacteroidetes bacterium]|nr:glycoside hydrolase family 31 protein [Bacteroidota bacterium]